MHQEALGLSTINGLPAHILLVHAVAVLIPLTAIYLVVAAVRPSIATRAGLLGPGLAAVAGLSVVAAMAAGGWLENHVPRTALMHKHTSMADGLLPFAFLMVVLSVVIWARHHREGSLGRVARLMPAGGGTATAVIAVLTVLICAAAVVQTVRIGESGSRAAWDGHFSATSTTAQGPGGY